MELCAFIQPPLPVGEETPREQGLTVHGCILSTREVPSSQKAICKYLLNVERSQVTYGPVVEIEKAGRKREKTIAVGEFRLERG